jgi:hypothetical protein
MDKIFDKERLKKWTRYLIKKFEKMDKMFDKERL